jgi:hypothetical protein
MKTMTGAVQDVQCLAFLQLVLTTLGPYNTIRHHITFHLVSQYQLQPLITSSCEKNTFSTFLVAVIDNILLSTL